MHITKALQAVTQQLIRKQRLIRKLCMQNQKADRVLRKAVQPEPPREPGGGTTPARARDHDPLPQPRFHRRGTASWIWSGRSARCHCTNPEDTAHTCRGLKRYSRPRNLLHSINTNGEKEKEDSFRAGLVFLTIIGHMCCRRIGFITVALCNK